MSSIIINVNGNGAKIKNNTINVGSFDKTPLKPGKYKKYMVFMKEESVVFGEYFRYIFRFKNGYGASIIKNPGSYGYRDDLFELCVIFFDGDSYDDYELDYSTTITDDVLGNLTNEEVLQNLEKIKNLQNTKEEIEKKRDAEKEITCEKKVNDDGKQYLVIHRTLGNSEWYDMFKNWAEKFKKYAENQKEVVVDLDEIFEEIEDFNNKKESENLSEDDFL